MENIENKDMAMQPSNGTAVQQTFNFFDPQQFATMQRYCKMYASSDLVPDSYRITDKESEGKAIGNCMIAMDIALRIGASPLMVMQNMTPIYGKPSWSSKFLIATINACGRFKSLKYKWANLGKIGIVEYTEYETTWETNPNTGKRYKRSTPKQVRFDGSAMDNIQCIAFTTEKNGDVELESTPVDLLMAIKEGWYTKNGSKWQTMPAKMLKYRAASFWANEYAPELSMGIYTVEENEDIAAVDGEAVVISSRTPDQQRVKVDFEQPAHQPAPAPKQAPIQQPATPPQQKQAQPYTTVPPVMTDDECGY